MEGVSESVGNWEDIEGVRWGGGSFRTLNILFSLERFAEGQSVCQEQSQK